MSAKQWGMLMVLLLASGAVSAEGGKQRGDVGQGEIIQGQVRVVDPPAQWDSSSAAPVAPGDMSVEPAGQVPEDEEGDDLFW